MHYIVAVNVIHGSLSGRFELYSDISRLLIDTSLDWCRSHWVHYTSFCWYWRIHMQGGLKYVLLFITFDAGSI